MIAAVCLSNDAVLATHNTKDFEHLGVTLTDPFTAPTPHVVEVTCS
jgi:predicted nucleic acid-binding protein